METLLQKLGIEKRYLPPAIGSTIRGDATTFAVQWLPLSFDYCTQPFACTHGLLCSEDSQFPMKAFFVDRRRVSRKSTFLSACRETKPKRGWSGVRRS